MRRNHIGEKVAVLTRLIAGATLPSGLVDPSVETALEHGVDTSKSEKVEEEQIFAAKYHMIQAHRRCK